MERNETLPFLTKKKKVIQSLKQCLLLVKVTITQIIKNKV